MTGGIDGTHVPLLVRCGIASAHKGSDRLVLAVSELRSRISVVNLLVVSPPGDDFERVHDLVSRVDLREQVSVMWDGVDAVPNIAAADVFVHAATCKDVNLVRLGALTLGVPLIAVNAIAGGPRLVLDDGTYGQLLHTGASPRDIADTLLKHMSDPDEFQTRASRAEGHVRQEFSVSLAAETSAWPSVGLAVRQRRCFGARDAG